jgi:hypothetical protein
MIRLIAVVASMIPAMDTMFIFYAPVAVGDTSRPLLMTLMRDHSTETWAKGDARVVRGRHELVLRPLAVARLAVEPERKVSAAGQVSRANCQPAVSRPQWSHFNQRRTDDRAMRSS